MKMELIQPYINATDAVLSETLKCVTRVDDVNMEPQAYKCKGLAAVVAISGDIEGRVIFDMLASTAAKIASAFSGGEEIPDDDPIVCETVCELANLVIGNAVTSLNDQGFSFKIHPPELHTAEQGLAGSEDTEALVLCFATPAGDVYLNVAMRYNRRRRNDASAQD